MTNATVKKQAARRFCDRDPACYWTRDVRSCTNMHTWTYIHTLTQRNSHYPKPSTTVVT